MRLPAVAALIALLAAPSVARAATITVDTGGDSGAGCTLRNAIDSANANANAGGCVGAGGYGDDTVDVPASVGPTITLNGTELAIGAPSSGKLDIVGPGAANLTISGNDASRVLHVTADALDAGDAVTISGLTIAHGQVQISSVNPGDPSGQASGGGILNQGTLTLDGVHVTGNQATQTAGAYFQSAYASGGGIFNQGGNLTVSHSTVDTNSVSASVSDGGSSNSHASTDGGGIDSGGDLTVTDSTVSGNQETATITGPSVNTSDTATVEGNGISSLSGSLEIDRSTISGNGGSTLNSSVGSGQNGAGGGLFRSAASAPTITESTIANNSVSTLPHDLNSSSNSSGGGIWDQGGLTLTSDTITGNTAQHGIALMYSPPGTPSFENTIFAGHTASAANCEEAGIGATPNSLGHNLSDDASCNTTATGDIQNTAPRLLSLGDHGGPTETEPPDVGSPAIDQGVAAGQTVDQRGLQRTWEFDTADGPSGDGTDIGAAEIQGPTPTGTTPPSPGGPSPKIFGTVEGNSAVDLFRGAGCGTPETTGPAGDFISPGLSAGPLTPDSSYVFSVQSTYGTATSVCSPTTIPYAVLPPAPSLTGTSPASGSNDDHPAIIGTAEPGTAVTLYTSPGCSGAPAGTGSAADLASPGIPVSVPDNSSTTFYANATGTTGTSTCSGGITYDEVAPLPPVTGGATGPAPVPPAPALPAPRRKCKKAKKSAARQGKKRCRKRK